MKLLGVASLQKRLTALRNVFKPLAQQWTEKTVEYAKATTVFADRTGKTRRSIRRRSVGAKRASVVVKGAGRYIERGYPPHDITPKKASRLAFPNRGGAVIFAKKVRHPRAAARPFLRPAGKRALHDLPALETIVRIWNRAA